MQFTQLKCTVTEPFFQALSPQFSQLLSQLLYTQPELRPSVLKALKVIVDSNVNPSLTDAISPEDIEKNVAFLRTQAESWLAVFFNVFSNVGRDARGVVGDVISSWAAIAGDVVSCSSFRNYAMIDRCP